MGLRKNRDIGAKPQPYNTEYCFAPNKNTAESRLQRTGLRGKSLCVVVFCLIVLWMISLATFICNVMLLIVLRLNHKGMQSLQFLHLKDDTHVLKFTSEQIHFDSVIPRSGLINNVGKAKFELESSSVKLVDRKRGTHGNASTILLEDDKVQISSVENFFIADPVTSVVIFEALNPKIKLERPLKGIAANIVKTRKVRAPVDQDLMVEAESVSFKGNEGNCFSGKNIALKAQKDLFITTSELGRINITAHEAIRLPKYNQMRLSSSPDFSANILGRRLCACISTGKLFTVQGNKRCSINPAYCY